MRVWLYVLALGMVLGCSDPEDGGRLIPPGDSDYNALEAPETAGECSTNADCEISCTHVCAPPPSGPVTCPSDPPPKPARVVGAQCLCADTVCAYF
jgi:hypothetical protein